MRLGEIAKEAFEGASANGWHDPIIDEHGILRLTSTFERLGLVHSEVSEAYEAFRKHGTKGWYGPDDKPEGMESELADVIIRVCELAYFFYPQYDLDVAVANKMKYNATRLDIPNKEGGKAI